MPTTLLVPSLDHLSAYAAALERGWSADNVRGKVAADEELARIAADPAGFVASLNDPQAKGAPIKQLDGSTRPRLPGVRRWIWDDGFCGSIGMRWQAGTSALPEWCPGHIGYAVVPWRRREGHATGALGMILPFARAQGLDYVEITAKADNSTSHRVVLTSGGREVERYIDTAVHGGAETVRFRIDLA